MKKLLYAFLLLTTFGISSCSKDDDSSSEVAPANYYTYGDEKHDIKWAGYYVNTTSTGYQFAVAPMTPANIEKLYNEQDYLVIDLPAEMLNKMNNLNDNLNGDSWSFYGGFQHDGEFYSIDDEQSESDWDDVTGTNNWIKVTKNTANHNYTVEFEITVGGKLLKGVYTGVFTNSPNYMDWGT